MSNNSQLCLDFANTLEMHASDHPQETLRNYADLVAWAQEKEVIRNSEKLLRTAKDKSIEAERVLDQAFAIREVIYRIFAAVAAGSSPADVDLATLNTALPDAMSGAQIIQSESGFDWQWERNENALDTMLTPIIRSAGELLTSDELKCVGQCADDRGCGWLFIDTSKNRSRRWCSMEDCGNRAKQRKHYQSKQGG